MPGEERVVAGGKTTSDRNTIALRPRRLAEMVGQDRVRENLSIIVEAAAARDEPIDHLLFYGPPGLGKTSLAYVISNEVNTNIRVTAGPAIERAGDLAAILTHLKKGDILFIDEVHRLGKAVEEILYPAMEDFVLDIVIGKGPAAKTLRINLPRFTVIGATTRLALLAAPLRDRFGARFRLDFYDLEAMEQIVRRAARLLDVEIKQEGVVEIARRARGTPRVGLRLLRRVRDYAEARADGTITVDVAQNALELMEIDHLGLDELDRRILHTVIEKFSGGPVGLDTIAAAISEDSSTIMDVYEPYLIQLGFIDRTPRGRVCTPHAYRHLEYRLPGIVGLLPAATAMKVSDFDYELPERYIAQAPADPRDSSRLLRYDRQSGEIQHLRFSDIIRLLRPNDVLVMNNTRVIKARLQARKVESGGKVEVLLLRQLDALRWRALVSGRNVGPGLVLSVYNSDITCEVLERDERSQAVIRFSRCLTDELDAIGEVPLPPYIRRTLKHDEQYQTVYGAVEGSAAAPTAGLHFTEPLLESIRAKGCKAGLLHTAYRTGHLSAGDGRSSQRPQDSQRVDS